MESALQLGSILPHLAMLLRTSSPLVGNQVLRADVLLAIHVASMIALIYLPAHPC